MKKFLTVFFVVLGVVFFCLLIILAYLFIADPFNLKSLWSVPPMSQTVRTSPATTSTTSSSTQSEVGAEPTTSEDRQSALSPAQENALILVGIDPAAVPAEITPEQLACFEARLGRERVAEIQAGAAPTVLEIIKAKECI